MQYDILVSLAVDVGGYTISRLWKWKVLDPLELWYVVNFIL